MFTGASVGLPPEQQSQIQPQPSHDARLPFSAVSPDARVTRAARRQEFVHRQPRPTHVGARREALLPREGKEWKCEEAGGNKDRAEERFHRSVCIWGDEGGKAEASPATAPAAGTTGGLRVMEKRPSDRRSPGRNPGPQGAFEVSMINVSCNSH